MEVGDKRFLRLGIQGRCTLVQDEHAAGMQQGAGYGNALGLAFGKAASGFSARGVQSVGEVVDKRGYSRVQGLF